MKTFVGYKDTMTQTWDKNGKRLPITVVSASPLLVTQVKTVKTDGYAALQVGIGTTRMKLVRKPQKGHLKLNAKSTPPRHLIELKSEDKDEYQVGDSIPLSDVLTVGDIVSVFGVTKGRGFAGVIKRWGFAGGPRTHGQSDRERAPGSIGQGTDPGRVHKGKKMPGRYGNQRQMVKHLTVVKVTDDYVWLSGPIPGTKGTIISITKKSQKDFPGLFHEEPEVDVETTSDAASESTTPAETKAKAEETKADKVKSSPDKKPAQEAKPDTKETTKQPQKEAKS